MSKIYKKSNFESTKDLFEKKLTYDLTARSKTSATNLVNFTFAEKALYGRVDRLYLPIVFSDKITDLKNIASKDEQTNVKAISFVADAFADLSNQFLKKMSINEISKDEEFLTNLVVKQGYISPSKVYDEYTELFIQAIGDIIRAEKIYFKDFEHFMNLVTPAIMSAIPKFPITFPAFVKSKHCPIFCSGLAIKISNINFENDAKKIKTFYQSKNWDFYVNAAASYGFMIDKNNPGVLVADIASSDMLRYARNYGFQSTDSILNGSYKHAHIKSIEKLRAILFTLYNRFKVKRFSNYVHVMPNKYKIVHVTPKSYTYQQLKTEYPDYKLLPLYCKIRIKEEESKFSYAEKNSFIKDTVEIGIYDMNKAIRSFEIILNKTFDYRGSLSYHKMRIDLLRQ